MYYAYQSLQAFGMGRLVWGREREEVACKQLSSSGRSGGGAGKGRKACNYVSGI